MFKGKKTAKVALVLFACSGIVIAADYSKNEEQNLIVGNDNKSTELPPPRPSSERTILEKLSDLFSVA